MLPIIRTAVGTDLEPDDKANTSPVKLQLHHQNFWTHTMISYQAGAGQFANFVYPNGARH
jgi:hypothetical protein